jgi:hypothetical protein
MPITIREGVLATRFLPNSVAPGLVARTEAIGEGLVAAGRHPGGIVAHHGSWSDLMAQAGLRPADSAALSTLLDEDAADGVMHRPDVFVLAVTTIHTTGPGTDHDG